MEIDDIIMTNTGFAIVLADRENNRVLPIFIGPFEANGILMKLQEVSFPRPLTYDLIKNILEMMGSKVEKVVISDLRDNTFYATLHILTENEILEIDSRPSDAIAICIRFGAPIYVAEKVMSLASIPEEDYNKSKPVPTQQEPQDMTFESYQTLKPAQSPKKPKDKQAILEKLEKELNKAIEEERYEDAAKIRDEINKIISEEEK